MSMLLGRIRRTGGWCCTGAAAFALVGCYSYVPVRDPRVPPDARVRVELSNAGIVRLSPLLGSGVVGVEGRVDSAQDSAYVVSVRDVLRASGASDSWPGGPVTVTRSDVARILEARLSPVRSVALAAGIAALVAAGAGAFASGGVTGTKQPPPNPTPK